MKIDIKNETVMNQMGYPFWEWAIYGQLHITEQDLRYIQIIKNHPCFSIIQKGYKVLSPLLTWANLRIIEIVFYEHFYYDLNCPVGVKNILFAIIGSQRGFLEDRNMLNLLNFRYHSVQLWIASATEKSSPLD